MLRPTAERAVVILGDEVMDALMYEYGYTITAKGESRDVVLGTVTATGYDSKKAEIDYANTVDAGSTSVWFIRSVNQA